MAEEKRKISAPSICAHGMGSSLDVLAICMRRKRGLSFRGLGLAYSARKAAFLGALRENDGVIKLWFRVERERMIFRTSLLIAMSKTYESVKIFSRLSMSIKTTKTTGLLNHCSITAIYGAKEQEGLNANDIRAILWIVTLISAIFSKVTIMPSSKSRERISSSNLALGTLCNILPTPEFSPDYRHNGVHWYVGDIVSSGLDPP
ncbi:hypothetical protein ALC57_12406 [Trachymyrmex cornetzi]|uniref:Uncharacterized protein n=1 Tax=Trachymyrmex cornetzi TaxID=471704 RepID=A0A195DRC1_9HYME|nr:hypothetical protein ALC57_12406 [Trachymyrmex cornetzi]